MPLLLFAAFVVIPLVELAVVIQVAEVFQLGPTLVVLVAISVAGAWLVRREGATAWRRFQRALAQGRPPTAEALDGALILVGGTLLLTPGFVTDAVGLALMLPPSRALASRIIRRRVRSLFRVVDLGSGRGRRRAGRDDDVIDVGAVDVERDRNRT